MGIEPTSSAWKAEVLPLNYTRALESQVQRFDDSGTTTTHLSPDR